MKLKKYLAKGLALGIVISNLPLYSFANNIENKYYNELSNIKTKDDLQKSAQRDGGVDTWIEGLTSMPTSRPYLSSAVIDEKIYCIGGYYTGTTDFNKVEVYDPVTDSWETKASMPTKRRSFAIAVVDGKIYCIGGVKQSATCLNTVEVYDPVIDKWETKTTMPTKRSRLTSSVVDGKIYCIGGINSGGSYINTVEAYDPIADSWETKASMPTSRGFLASSVVDGKIYCIGGTTINSNEIEVYNPQTDSWETKTSMPTGRHGLTSSVVDGKIYCIGGIPNYTYLNTVEVYNPVTDSWETKASMPTARGYFTSAVLDGKIYCIGGANSSGSYLNTVEAYIAKEPSLEDKASSFVSNAEVSKDLADVEVARELVNQLPEGELKKGLQARLDAIIPNISLTLLNGTSSIDTYIKTENILSMTVDTNTITFEDFSGIEDMNKANAINVTVSSSLPYQLNAYLPVEIQNGDKTKTMDKSILNIKENGELEYKTFMNLNTKVILKDNCIAGDDIHHGIDLKLKQGIAHEKDVYKATIKLEVEQK